MPSLSPTTRRPAHGLFPGSASGPAQGFTIMELLVVISIIAVIAALLIGGVTALRGGAQEAQTRTLLAGLMGLEGHYQVQFESTAGLGHITDKNFGKQSDNYRWTNTYRQNAEGFTGTVAITGSDPAGDDNGTDPYNDAAMENANLYIERFLFAANQMPVIREKLPTLGQAFGDADNDGFIDIVDAWGNPIAYANNVVHPTPNPLTSTNNATEDDFLPEYKGPFFASAGKDQRWGRPRTSGEFASTAAWEAYKGTDDYKFTLDNLYSFDIDRSAAQRGD